MPCSLWLQPHSVPGELQVGSSGTLRGPGLAQASGHSLAGPEEPAACESVLAGEQRAGRVGFSPPQVRVNASSGHSLRALKLEELYLPSLAPRAAKKR